MLRSQIQAFFEDYFLENFTIRQQTPLLWSLKTKDLGGRSCKLGMIWRAFLS